MPRGIKSALARWWVRGLLCGPLAGGLVLPAASAQEPAAGPSFEVFAERLPLDHGLALAWGRGHVLSLATALTEPGDGLGLREPLKLTAEQDAALKAELARQVQETVKAPAPPDPTAPNPEAEAFAALETLDAAGRAAFAAAKLSPEQKSLVFRALLAIQGAEALRSQELAPATLKLEPAREAAIRKHVQEQFFRTVPSPTDPKPTSVEVGSPERRQEVRRAAMKTLDRAIWEQLSPPQREEMIKQVADLPKLNIPVPAADREPASENAPPGDPIPAPETPAPPKSPGLAPPPK
ncbi:MAG TPA: hypothetical protein VGE52_02295 [Pirellulales bacterium]